MSATLTRYATTLVTFLMERDLLVSTKKLMMALFSPDTNEYKIHPQVKVDNLSVPLERTPKLQNPGQRDLNHCIQVCCLQHPGVCYTVWSPIISESRWEDLQRVQNYVIRVATGCYLKSDIGHLHVETKVSHYATQYIAHKTISCVRLQACQS